MSFTQLSLDITKKICKEDKKKFGIFFTPQETIKIMIERIKNHILNGIDILEPSCGSCEIISYIDKEFDNISITGIEHNDDIFEKIKNITFSNNVSILKDDFLKHSYSKKYDIIVGNPPYFVMSKKDYPSDYNLFFFWKT